MPDLLIRNADYVVTVDNDRRIIRDGAIPISGKKIVAAGKTQEVAPRYPNAEVCTRAGAPAAVPAKLEQN
jgi:cytosine/adenosine deaminase-related metal-dependent hydrolase